MVGAHLAANALIDAQRAKQMQELGEVALRRSEAAVDYGVATLDELLKRGSVSCDPTALQAVRLLVYRRSAVKDMRVVNRDGAVLCSAYSETLEFDKVWPSRAEMLAARDGTALLFRVEQFFGVALGVLKQFDAETGLVAILGMNAYLFDVMPTELREHSEVLLELNDGKTVADYLPAGRTSLATGTIDFTMASDRYPLRTVIRVDAAAFDQWNREIVSSDHDACGSTGPGVRPAAGDRRGATEEPCRRARPGARRAGVRAPTCSRFSTCAPARSSDARSLPAGCSRTARSFRRRASSSLRRAADASSRSPGRSFRRR